MLSFADPLARARQRGLRWIDRGLRAIDTRAVKRAYWEVQAGVILVTLLHYATEARINQPPFDEIHHLPVTLYAIPIVYASIRFGTDGGVRTGLWAVALCIPNIVVFHQDWVSAAVEMAQVVVALAVGVVLSATVDGERRLRDRAERLTQQVRGMNALILRAHEAERLHISRELHDEVVQQLALICQQLDLAVMDASPSGQFARDLARIRAAVVVSVDDLRRFARGLRPPILDDLGLVPAVQGLIAESQKQYTASMNVDLRGEARRLDPEVELTCFRIVQEAVHNALNHAHPASVTVTLEFTPAVLRVRIEDDGDGFSYPLSLDRLVAAGHLGLAGMFERARLIGATLEVQTEPHRGTRVLLDIPLASEQAGSVPRHRSEVDAQSRSAGCISPG